MSRRDECTRCRKNRHYTATDADFCRCEDNGAYALAFAIAEDADVNACKIYPGNSTLVYAMRAGFIMATMRHALIEAFQKIDSQTEAK